MVKVLPTHIANGVWYVKFELAGNVTSSLIHPTILKPLTQIEEVIAGWAGDTWAIKSLNVIAPAK